MSGWQPIETAPRDGTTVLTMHKDDLYPVSALTFKDVGAGEWFRETEGPDDIEINGRHDVLYRTPTHWMPLPEPPWERDR